MKELHHYQANFSQKLQAEHAEKFKEKYVAFRSIMEEIDLIEP